MIPIFGLNFLGNALYGTATSCSGFIQKTKKIIIFKTVNELTGL